MKKVCCMFKVNVGAFTCLSSIHSRKNMTKQHKWVITLKLESDLIFTQFCEEIIPFMTLNSCSDTTG